MPSCGLRNHFNLKACLVPSPVDIGETCFSPTAGTTHTGKPLFMLKPNLEKSIKRSQSTKAACLWTVVISCGRGWRANSKKSCRPAVQPWNLGPTLALRQRNPWTNQRPVQKTFNKHKQLSSKSKVQCKNSNVKLEAWNLGQESNTLYFFIRLFKQDTVTAHCATLVSVVV